MPHPPYSSFSIERICAPLCQQVRYCTLSILDSTLSKPRTTCQFRTDSEHQLTFLSQIKQKILKPLRFQDFSWSEWNYRVSRNYEQQKWYSGSRQSVFLSEISYYAKRNSSLSKLGISFLFDKLNSATAAFKAFPKGWLAVAILLFWQVATKCSFVKILSSILFEI